MKYVYQYDVAAILVNMAMLLIFFLRNKFVTRSNIIFRLVIVCNLLAAVTDLVSIFTVSYPENYPLWLNYLMCLSYLFLYNEMSVLYFMYIDSKGKIGKFAKFAKILSTVTTVFFAVTIFLSPVTHWVAYFNENLEYTHGPVFMSFQIIPYIFFALEIFIFIKARKNFNSYQILASTLVVLGMALAVLVSILRPEILIGQLVMAIIMFYVYITYENPTYYSFADTQCLNYKALNEYLNRTKYLEKKFSALVFKIDNYAHMRSYLNDYNLELAVAKVADIVYRRYGAKAYNIANDRFVIVCDETMMDFVKEDLKDLLEIPLFTASFRFKVSLSFKKINVHLKDVPDMMSVLLRTEEDISEDNYDEVVDKIINSIIRKERILNAVRNAIKANAFEVFYQPIINLSTGKYESAEALIRLKDPEIGFINPEEMIVLAEKNGLINEVGNQVFAKVCKFIHDGLPGGIKYIEVNLSPMQCLSPEMSLRFMQIMKENDVNPSQINLEITETAETIGSDVVKNNINELNEKGVEFSIDDYGSGFASAEYLIKFPISIVKIDKTILWQAMKDEVAMTVFVHTIKLLKDLKKHIVVEGAEDEKMVGLLKENECDFCQGYYYSKPLPPKEFMEFLSKNA
ncbi:MAG: EAL domain-containing protein [Lachnospiraceae bacterium]|nr:EAL domain-containing protein [Lachnospiraceae bacterium]